MKSQVGSEDRRHRLPSFRLLLGSPRFRLLFSYTLLSEATRRESAAGIFIPLFAATLAGEFLSSRH